MSKAAGPDPTERRGQKRRHCPKCGHSLSAISKPPSRSITSLDLSKSKRRRVEITGSHDDVLSLPGYSKSNTTGQNVSDWLETHYNHENRSDRSRTNLVGKLSSEEEVLKELLRFNNSNDVLKLVGKESQEFDDNSEDENSPEKYETKPIGKLPSEESVLKEMLRFYNCNDVLKLVSTEDAEFNTGDCYDSGGVERFDESYWQSLKLTPSEEEMFLNEDILYSLDDDVWSMVSGHEGTSKRSKCQLSSKIVALAGMEAANVDGHSRGSEGNSDESDPEDDSTSEPETGNGARNRKRRDRAKSNRKSNYGSNYFDGRGEASERRGLRPVIIDGSNVAISHTRGRYFSCKGLEMCVKYFLGRGHKVYALVPHYRLCKGQARDQHILDELFHRGHLFFTPSRMVEGRRETSYDDRFMIQLAASTGGVLVSNDRYRDFLHLNPGWDDAINNRLLMFMWVDNMLFFAQDPRGKNGPTLAEFLSF